jgi:N-acetylglucosamine kinase-like BadF-type ATPase
MMRRSSTRAPVTSSASTAAGPTPGSPWPTWRGGSSCAALVRLVRETADAAATTLPVAGLCAGLAGAGSDEARRVVRRELAASGVAARLAVIQDGEIALEGALAGEAGILLVAGTGSVALGRAEDGRIERCGGWGMLVGDEGSGYTIARAALRAALQAADGRGEPTRLLPELLDHLGLSEPRELVEWVGRTEKAEVAALAPHVSRLAEQGDPAALRIVDAAAGDLARHVEALLGRLGPWSGAVPLVFYGGALEDPDLARRVEKRLPSTRARIVRQSPDADAVTGAIRRAIALVR